jgi:hypothetical protein
MNAVLALTVLLGYETTVNGYLDERLTLQRVREDALVDPAEVPRFLNLTEANVQLKLRWGERALALADASFFYQRAAGFPGGDKDVPAYRPLAVLSELYGSYSVGEHANLTLGKKRVVWGPGFVINPSDLLNPPKDPTDPSLQRAGAWLARVELPYQRFTLSLLGAARATREYGGVPAALAVYPAGDPESDGQAHVAAAARLYALVADTDVNLVYWFTNRYNDAFESKSRVALTFSRLVGKALEVHGEALGQLGSARPYVTDAGVALSKIDNDTLYVHALAGGRYQFANDAMLGADYALYSDGYDDSEWRAVLAGLQQARALGIPVAALFAAATPTGGTPQRVVFQPLRRHYLFLYFTEPRIRDDFTFNLTVFGSLEDGSGLVSPQLVWSVREWLSLTLQLFAPIPALAPVEVNGVSYGEFDLAPADYRAMLSARVFY